MKVKTSELKGKALDWAVAKCEGLEPGIIGGRIWTDKPGVFYPEVKPTIDAEQALHLQHKAKISLHYCIDLRDVNGKYVHCHTPGNMDHGYWVGDWHYPLVAVMRCYVNKFQGDEVEIPDELC